MPNSPDETLFFKAAAYGQTEELRRLLPKVNINFQGSSNFTPLFGAAMRGQLDSIKFLLSSGADPLMKNDRGKTALEVANTRKPTDLNRKETIDLLLLPTLIKAIEIQDLELIKKITFDFSVNYQNENVDPIAKAREVGNSTITKILEDDCQRLIRRAEVLKYMPAVIEEENRLRAEALKARNEVMVRGAQKIAAFFQPPGTPIQQQSQSQSPRYNS